MAFVDNVVFFRVNKKTFNTIRRVLVEFTNFSGLEVNQQKSSILFSKGVSNQEELRAILGYQTEALPMNHMEVLVTRRLVQF